MDPLALDLGRYERGLRDQGFRLIAGVDEAGRGALAGPLVAAAVILPAAFDLEGINDSKVLTRLQREAAYERIVSSIARRGCPCSSEMLRTRLSSTSVPMPSSTSMLSGRRRAVPSTSVSRAPTNTENI